MVDSGGTDYLDENTPAAGTARGHEGNHDKARETTHESRGTRGRSYVPGNIALKLVLEHRAVPNWQPLLTRLLADKETLAGVHLKFRDLYGKLEGSDDPAEALDTLLAELSAKIRAN
jgi:hypothetical protein